MKQIVVKADEKEEDFNKDKLNDSMLKAGAGSQLSASTADEIDRYFKGHMKSDDIYNRVLDHVRKSDPMAALKYTLKRAILGLGPDGFTFEKYAAKVLGQNGYTIKMPQQLLSGFCVDHEVDIIALGKDESMMVECKFLNFPGNRLNIKTPLYINSRFLDLKKGEENKNTSTNSYYFTGAWLFTNAKCSSDAIKYANCSRMKITAWNYPEDESLQFYIESKKLYPVTILSTLSPGNIKKLFEKNILTIKELIAFQIEDLMELLSLNDNYASKVLDEISLLSN